MKSVTTRGRCFIGVTDVPRQFLTALLAWATTFDVESEGGAVEVQPCVEPSCEPKAELLVHELSGNDRLEIAAHLRRALVEVNALFVGGDRSVNQVDLSMLDVAAINLAGGPKAFAFAAEVVQLAPWVQVVFWGNDQATTVQAARSLGLARVIPKAQIGSWLCQAIGPLTRLSRAKRMALEAEATIPCPPSFGDAGQHTLALPEAERQFREAYLRGLLSESPNAKRAAERAGVPYTTLCSMMKKLGLSKRAANG